MEFCLEVYLVYICYTHRSSQNIDLLMKILDNLDIQGESDTRHRDSGGANATRVVFAIWILYSFLIAASYSGALKAFLTLPVYQPPIDTLGDVLDSGLPWGMVSVTSIGCLAPGTKLCVSGAVRRGGGGDDGVKPGGICHQEDLG